MRCMACSSVSLPHGQNWRSELSENNLTHTPGDISSRTLHSIYLGVHTVPSCKSSRVLEVYLGISIHQRHIELNPDHVHQRREAEHHVSTLWPEGGGSPVDSDGGISSGHQWGLGTWTQKQYGGSKAALRCVGGYVCMYVCVCGLKANVALSFAYCALVQYFPYNLVPWHLKNFWCLGARLFP